MSTLTDREIQRHTARHRQRERETYRDTRRQTDTNTHTQKATETQTQPQRHIHTDLETKCSIFSPTQFLTNGTILHALHVVSRVLSSQRPLFPQQAVNEGRAVECNGCEVGACMVQCEGADTTEQCRRRESGERVRH